MEYGVFTDNDLKLTLLALDFAEKNYDIFPNEQEEYLSLLTLRAQVANFLNPPRLCPVCKNSVLTDPEVRACADCEFSL